VPAGRTTRGTGVKKHAVAWAKGLLKYGIGFGLLAYVLHQNWDPKFGPPAPDGTPGAMLSPGIAGLLERTPDLLTFAALAAIICTCTGIQFVRWYLLVRALDLPFTLGNAFRLGLVGAFYNAFLPGSVGGDLVKAYFIAKDQPGRRASAVATVVADRLVGLFGLIWFAAAFGGAFWLAGDERIVQNDYLQKIIRVCAGLVAAAVAGWVVLGLLSQRRADWFAGWLGSVPKVGKTLAEVWYAVWTYRQRPRVVYTVIAMTAVVHVGFVFMYHLAVRVFPATDPGTIAEHFVIAPIGYIAQAFFPAPGGVGGGEAIFGYLYTLLGRPESTGVVGRLTLRVCEWGIGLVGLVLFLRMRDELAVAEDEAEEEGYGGHDEPPAGDQKVG
jgi:uncharacterized membrane protein YbhN (UPF0104 family)